MNIQALKVVHLKSSQFNKTPRELQGLNDHMGSLGCEPIVLTNTLRMVFVYIIETHSILTVTHVFLVFILNSNLII